MAKRKEDLTAEVLGQVMEEVKEQAEKPMNVELGWKKNGWLKN